MKKVLFTLGLALAVVSASAQEERVAFAVVGESVQEGQKASKAAKTYGHEAGDMSISVDAAPFFRYVGNLFNGTMNNAAPTIGEAVQLNANTLDVTGKYFLNEKSAIRVSLGFDFRSQSEKTLVNEIPQPTPAPAPGEEPKVTDVTKYAYSDFGLKIGYEFRKGQKRVQGFYGAGIALSASSTTDSYKPGNAISVDNPLTGVVTKEKSGLQFGIGLNAFAGVEYYITPQIAIGAELGLDLMYVTPGKGAITTESWNTTDNKVDVVTQEQYTSDSDFRFRTILNPGIYVSFGF
jgi:hypothetical protein